MTRRSKTNTVSRRAVLGGAAAGAAIGTLGFPSVLRAHRRRRSRSACCIRSPAPLAYKASSAARAPCWRSRRSTPPAASSRWAAPSSKRCSPTRSRSRKSAPPRSTSWHEAGVVAVHGAVRQRHRACHDAGGGASTTCRMSSMSAWSTRSSARADQHVPLRARLRQDRRRSRSTTCQTINDSAGKPAKTVVIVHEDGAFGGGMAKLLNERAAGPRLPGAGDDQPPDPARATSPTSRCSMQQRAIPTSSSRRTTTTSSS